MSDPLPLSDPFGVLEFLSWDHPWNRQHNSGDKLSRSIDALKEVGSGFVRFDFLWSDIEPADGQSVFERYDRIVDRLQSNHIGILGILAYTPTWISQDWRQAPDPQLYCRYARAMVRRYKDRVNHWEIWHEPDSETFWHPQDHMRAYSKLLRRVYSEMKEEDSSCVVHLGGLSKALPGSLKEIYECGSRYFFDIVQYHAFTNPQSDHALEGSRALYDEIRHIMSSHGDQNKEVWITQFACPGMRRLADAPAWWLGLNLTEEQQADWLTKAMSEALQWSGVGKIFWSFLRDTDRHFNSGVDYFGLLRHDFSKKPSFYAYQKLVHSWRSKLTASR